MGQFALSWTIKKILCSTASGHSKCWQILTLQHWFKSCNINSVLAKQPPVHSDGVSMVLLSANVKRSSGLPYAGFLKLCNASAELSNCKTPIGPVVLEAKLYWRIRVAPKSCWIREFPQYIQFLFLLGFPGSLPTVKLPSCESQIDVDVLIPLIFVA